jgi:hypothetical protein
VGTVLAGVIWAVIGAIPGAIVGAVAYGVAWMAAYGTSGTVNPWWFWGPLIVGAVIGGIKGVLDSGESFYRRTPKVDSAEWRLEEIRRNTEQRPTGD